MMQGTCEHPDILRVKTKETPDQKEPRSYVCSLCGFKMLGRPVNKFLKDEQAKSVFKGWQISMQNDMQHAETTNHERPLPGRPATEKELV